VARLMHLTAHMVLSWNHHKLQEGSRPCAPGPVGGPRQEETSPLSDQTVIDASRKARHQRQQYRHPSLPPNALD